MGDLQLDRSAAVRRRAIRYPLLKQHIQSVIHLSQGDLIVNIILRLNFLNSPSINRHWSNSFFSMNQSAEVKKKKNRSKLIHQIAIIQ